MASYGLDYIKLREQFPDIIYCSVTPFGLEGPWASYKSSDIVSLALGGVMSLCGYDEDDLPPIAPTGGQTSHMVGTFTVTSILAALHYRDRTNVGQLIDVSAHEASICNNRDRYPDVGISKGERFSTNSTSCYAARN